MEAVIVTAGVGVLLLLIGLVLWRRSASRSGGAEATPAAAPATPTEGATLAVPLPNARGEALLLPGSGEPEVVPLSPELRERLDGGAPADAAAAERAAALALAAALRRQLEQLEGRLTRLRADLGPAASGPAAASGDALDAELRLLSATPGEQTRAERARQLERLLSGERLRDWLARRIDAELADSRSDAGRLDAEPEAVRQSIVTRERRLATLGVVLADLSDPQARRPLDPLRQSSRRRLAEHAVVIEQVLPRHSDAFAGPEHDPYAVSDARPDQVRVLSGGS